LLWRAYVRRFDLEHTFRFFKQALGWTTPRVRHPEQADRWTWLVMAAFTQLRLARAYVEDLRLPWERRYETGRLTPIRVHRVVSALLGHLGTPAKAPKPCGRSPGRPKGRLSLAEPNATRPSRRPLESAKMGSEGVLRRALCPSQNYLWLKRKLRAPCKPLTTGS
jgi:hypothetical protein